MKVLAFDLASTTGVAFGDSVVGVPDCFTEVLGEAGSTHDARFCQTLRMARRLIDAHKPDLIAYEEPIAAGVAGKSARVQLAMGYAACLQGVAYMRGIPTLACRVDEVRSFFIGERRLKRDVAKSKVFNTCRTLGWSVGSDNESDAAAVWAYALHRNAGVSLLPTNGLFKNEHHQINGKR